MTRRFGSGNASDIINALDDHFTKALRAPDLAERFAKEGADIVASSPAQFGAYLNTELVRWAKVVKESGLRAD